MKLERRRIALAALAAVIGGGALFYGVSRPSAEAVPMTVYMTRECGCCGEWVAHMKRSGFLVTPRYMTEEDLWRLKDLHGVPPSTRSCHTAEILGYVIEGHTPADVVRRLLARRPGLVGVAVPGMPFGSPGMEVPSGRSDPYEVVAFDREGALTVLERR